MDHDVVLASLGLLAALAMIGYSVLILGRLVFALYGMILAVTCASWFIIRRAWPDQNSLNEKNTPLAYLLGIIFFILFIITIVQIYQRPDDYSRPLTYFILTAAMAGTVALEILVASPRPVFQWLILVQVLLIGASLEFSQIFLFPDVIGIDPAIHQSLVNGIISNGQITPGSEYSSTPLFQIEIAIGSLIEGVNYKVASYLVTIAEVIIPPLSIFLIGKHLFGVKIGLLAALLLSVAPYHIYFGIWAVPNTLAVLVIPLALYLLLRLRIKWGEASLVLVTIMMVSLVLTHPVASMGFALILVMIWFLNRTYRSALRGGSSAAVGFNIVMLFLVSMFGWWTFVGGQTFFLASSFSEAFQVNFLFDTPEVVSNFVYTIPLTEQLLRYLGMFVFFSLSLLGCLFMVSKKGRNLNRYAIVIAGLVPLIIGFISLAFALTSLELRWFYLAEFFMALPLAVFLILLYGNIRPKSVSKIMVLLIVCSVAFLGIASPSGSIDNNVLFPNTGVRYAFTESELAGASFLSERSVGFISSDFDYATDKSSSPFINYYGVTGSRILSLDDELLANSFTRNGTMKIIRSEIATEPIRMYNLPYDLGYDPRPTLQSSDFNRVYDSGSVAAYI